MSVLKTGKKILFLILFAVSYNIYALDIEITSKSIEASLNGESNKVYDFIGDTSILGELELNNIFLLRGGLSIGRLEDNIELRTTASAKASPFNKVPLDFSLLWIYRGIFEYDVHSNSIVPFATYNWKVLRLSLGYNFRFTSFFGESGIFEATPVYSFYFNIINNDIIHLAFIFGNFNEFSARFITEYSYNFYAFVRINDNWQIINSIDILQTGAIAFTETVYGIAFKMGVKYTW